MKHLLIIIAINCTVNFAFAQAKISGTVTDMQAQPLAGASITVLETASGTSTNAEGKFALDTKLSSPVIAIQFLGYKTIIDTLQTGHFENLVFKMSVNPILSDEFVVEALRAESNTPMTYQNLDSKTINANNLGQDLPILMNQTVSTVTTSDAGAGVGYTGMRIRGTDGAGINVTVNGVPLNDAESHGVFWVNMPDFASSTNSIQIQRGVGSSTNGAGAFGASINIQTSGVDSNSSVVLNNSFGSFNTRKHNVIYNSGILSHHFSFEGRLSMIGSDGYIDRSGSILKSWYFSGGYFGKRYFIKAVTFSGHEITHQAWWGTPQSRLSGDMNAMKIHAQNNGYNAEQTYNLLHSGRTYNYYTYTNEVDNYQQDHYQLIQGFELSKNLYLNITAHYTRGRGYFEQYNYASDLADYGLAYPVIGGDTIMNSDVIVRRWLDNHFYGGVYSLKYTNSKLNLTLGGATNQYLGKHFGEIIWAESAEGLEKGQHYYDAKSTKTDISNYIKAEYTLGKLTLYGDLQARNINYRSHGTDNDLRPVAINQNYIFFNPKAGLSFAIKRMNQLYASIAQAYREPLRSDFTDAIPGVIPKPEQLSDVEVGWKGIISDLGINVNGYWMNYKNQLVMTGELNDVGAPIRVNVPISYRAGIECAVNYNWRNTIMWSANATVSQNKIKQFDEVLYDFTNGFDQLLIPHNNSDLAFSPKLILGSQLTYDTDFGMSFTFMTKFVGRQYLDNTADKSRSIRDYWVNDFRWTYKLSSKLMKNFELTALVNNIFNRMYSSNGYTYSYYYGGLVTENFYYPQAGTNFLVGCKMKF